MVYWNVVSRSLLQYVCACTLWSNGTVVFSTGCLPMSTYICMIEPIFSSSGSHPEASVMDRRGYIRTCTNIHIHIYIPYKHHTVYCGIIICLTSCSAISRQTWYVGVRHSLPFCGQEYSQCAYVHSLWSSIWSSTTSLLMWKYPVLDGEICLVNLLIGKPISAFRAWTAIDYNATALFVYNLIENSIIHVHVTLTGLNT